MTTLGPSTMDRAVATLHVRPPGVMLERSDAMHAVELARLLGRLSLEARDRYLGVREYERSPVRADARNGFYERDVVTRLGTVRVRVARTRQRAFLPAGLVRLERRAAEVLLLIREAFLRGLSSVPWAAWSRCSRRRRSVHRRSRG
jgi:transposase-like protein